jgi:hypothetical protein
MIYWVSYFGDGDDRVFLAQLRVGADSLDHLFGVDQAFQNNLPDRAGLAFVHRFDFEHDDFFFDLVEPKFFFVFTDVEVEAIDLGFASPGDFVPESTELPNSSNVPAF